MHHCTIGCFVPVFVPGTSFCTCHYILASASSWDMAGDHQVLARVTTMPCDTWPRVTCPARYCLWLAGQRPARQLRHCPLAGPFTIAKAVFLGDGMKVCIFAPPCRSKFHSAFEQALRRLARLSLPQLYCLFCTLPDIALCRQPSHGQECVTDMHQMCIKVHLTDIKRIQR